MQFSGVGEFIDTQVKRCAYGMNACPRFANAAHREPKVMIIDEVLSADDAPFQDKCIRHMRGRIACSVPVVLASHNHPVVLELCTIILHDNHRHVPQHDDM